MSQINTNAILDASGGTTATVNGFTPTVSNMAGRNRIINGNFQVAQRGTSASVTTSSYFVLDRWITYPGTSGGAATVSQESFTVGQTDVVGEPEYFLKHNQTTGGTGVNIQQRIEGVRFGAGQNVTLSFYAKVASGTLSVTPNFRQDFGSGGSSDVDTTGSAFTLTTSWQKFTQTVTLPSISGKTIGASNFLALRLEAPDSTTFEINIAQVQLEEGSVATPFENRHYGQELALCQRYYYKTTPEASARAATLGYNATTTIHNGVGSFPVPLRITPTALEQSGTASNYGVAYLSTSATASAVPAFDSRTSNTMYVVQFTVASGLTAGQASRGQSLNANGFLAWSAEL